MSVLFFSLAAQASYRLSSSFYRLQHGGYLIQRTEDCKLGIAHAAVTGLQLRGLVELPRVALSKAAMKCPPSLKYFFCCL